MLCEITLEPGYLSVEIYNRQTDEETRDALAAISAAARKHDCFQILISNHASRPIFKVERSGFLEYFKGFGDTSRYRIALTGDSEELRLSQQYIELLAQRAGINIRSFHSEQAALDWFRDRRWVQDRRQRQDPWQGREDRRRHWRRGLERLRPA
jgi:hypothetical protein